MPGVLIVEALAQTGAVCALALPENAGKLVLFAGIDKVRFKRVVRPGDTLRLEVQVSAMRAGVGRGTALATVEGQVACRGELMFALTDAARRPTAGRRAAGGRRHRRSAAGRRRRRMTRGVIRGARIASVGVSLPERVLTNEEISRTLDTSDEWIRTRTGIRERRIAAADQAPSDLAAEAGARALERAGVSARDLDLVISSSLVPGHGLSRHRRRGRRQARRQQRRRLRRAGRLQRLRLRSGLGRVVRRLGHVLDASW